MKRIILVSVLLLFSMIAGSTQAQNANAPIILLVSGDLWSWDGTASSLRQLTNWGFQQDMSLSPDGKQVAYISYPQIVADFIHREGGLGGGALPTSIWVMDIASGNARRIADQPPDASFFVQGVPDKVIVRSTPAWSPDGTKMAWTEYDFANENAQRVVVYDFATGQSKTIVNSLPPQYGVPTPIKILWNRVGIIVDSFTPNSVDMSYDETFMVYTPDGQPVVSIPMLNRGTPGLSLPVIANGQDAIAVQSNASNRNLFDLRTGASQSFSSTPQPYSLLAPDAPPVVRATESADTQYTLQLLDAQGQPNGEPINMGYGLDRLAISPDGRGLAFMRYDAVSKVYTQNIEIWRDGQLVTIPNDNNEYIVAFDWGPVAWRVSDSATQNMSSPASVFTCPGALPARLTKGGQGRVVSGGGPNNLRDTPTLSGTVISQIPEGGVFSISDGPVCANSLVWWQVSTNGQSGWTVEGQNGTYYLEPLS